MIHYIDKFFLSPFTLRAKSTKLSFQIDWRDGAILMSDSVSASKNLQESRAVYVTEPCRAVIGQEL